MQAKLFQWLPTKKRLHSGGLSNFIIDCDALSHLDLLAIGRVLRDALDPYTEVEAVVGGVSTLRLAKIMYDLRHNEGGLLIVDDVLTTGRSMEEKRAGRDAIGAVIFARGPSIPVWVTPLFEMYPTGPRSSGDRAAVS